MTTLNTCLDERRVVVVVGPGGVGKTTTAAALAMEAARRGRNVLVLTVDPARRLMNSLGLDGAASTPTRVPPAAFAEAQISLGSGALHAMMLDVQQTFDSVVHRHAPDEAVRRRIMDNPFYAEASTSLAGSQEYMAMEALYALDQTDEFDLIVLDTPPTAHALDFITAPDRLTEFLQVGSFKLVLSGFARASRLGLGLFQFDNALLEVMNRFIGAEVFLRLVDFVDAFQEMYDGFQSRAQKVTSMLRSDETAFAIVSSTRSVAMREGLFLYERLRSLDLNVEAFIANRIALDQAPQVDMTRLHAALADAATPDDLARELARGAERAVERARADAEVDRERLTIIERTLAPEGPPLLTVPRFERDICDLEGLATYGARLAGA